MKYFWRLVVYSAIFFLTFSVSYTLCAGIVPVTITPLKIVKLFENGPENSFRVYSQWRGLDRINPSVMRAVMASEDNFFLVHNGFDWKSIQLAIEERESGKRKRGASTISQQTAKNVFCYPSAGWVRKGFETYYTILMETFWSKRRIMEVYLNVIETGANVYGVPAAANIYFKKDASALNVYDASMIATVLPNPIRMNLARPSSYMIGRAGDIRSLMRMLPVADFDNREQLMRMYKTYTSK